MRHRVAAFSGAFAPAQFKVLALAMGAGLVLSGCGRGGGTAMPPFSPGPVAVVVIPARPLEIPPALTLPPPTPGGPNRADP